MGGLRSSQKSECQVLALRTLWAAACIIQRVLVNSCLHALALQGDSLGIHIPRPDLTYCSLLAPFFSNHILSLATLSALSSLQCANCAETSGEYLLPFITSPPAALFFTGLHHAACISVSLIGPLSIASWRHAHFRGALAHRRDCFLLS
jgi:hypothetical protein